MDSNIEKWPIKRLGDVAEINPSKSEIRNRPDDLPVSFVPMAAVDAELGAISKRRVRPLGEVRKGFKYFREGDVIFARITPCLENGKCAIAVDLENGIGLGSTEFLVVRPNSIVLKEWIYHFLRQESVRNQAQKFYTGTVGQQRVSMEFLEDQRIPIPSIDIQMKMIEFVQRFLERTFNTKQELSRIPDLTRRLRMAILSKAFRGELTKQHPTDMASSLLEKGELLDQRKEKKKNSTSNLRTWKIPKSWVWTTLTDISKLERGRFSHRPRNEPRFYDGPYPFIQTGDISQSGGRITKYKQTLNKDGLSISKMFKKGTVLVAIAANIADSAILEFDACATDSVVAITPFDGVTIAEYIEYFMKLRKSEIEMFAPATAQKNINLRILRALEIPLAPLSEQQRIVGLLNSFFNNLNFTNQRSSIALETLKKLEGSILSKAFRGELLGSDIPAQTTLDEFN